MINEIKFHDEHPILRGLHLNFSKEDGTPYKTIIIAGENGCGKTTIFENLEVLMLGEIGSQDCFKFFDAIGYTVIHAGKIVNTTLKRDFHDNTRAVLRFESADFSSPLLIRGISRMLEETRTAIYAKQMTEDDRDIRFYAFVYARARTGFPMGELTYIRTLRCDHGKRQGCYNSPYDTRKTEDYSLLKELLISVYTINKLVIQNIAEQIKKG